MHGREARGTAVADAINADGGKARFVAADLSRTSGQTIWSSRAGPVDILVNNAGVVWTGPTTELEILHYVTAGLLPGLPGVRRLTAQSDIRSV